MIPRECDNDDCDYETYDAGGQGRARWVHVPSCPGPAEVPDLGTLMDNAREGSFLEYMAYSLGRK